MRCSILRKPRNKQVPLSVCWSARMLTRTTMCARCRFLCVGMSVFSAVLLCKSTNRIYVNPRIEASLLPTSFQAISQLMLTEMCGRNWGYVRSLSLMFLELAALRVGEVLNTESLANDCGISVDTAKSWLSILGSSFIAFRLRPYFKITESGLLKRQSFIFTILDIVGAFAWH